MGRDVVWSMRVLLALALSILAFAGCTDSTGVGSHGSEIPDECGDMDAYDCWAELYGYDHTESGTVEIPVVVVESDFQVTPRSDEDGYNQAQIHRLKHCGDAHVDDGEVRIQIAPFEEVPESILIHRIHSDADMDHVDRIDTESSYTAGGPGKVGLLAMFDDHLLDEVELDAGSAVIAGQAFQAGGAMSVGPAYSYRTEPGSQYQDLRFDVDEQLHVQYLGILEVDWTQGIWLCD